MRGRSSISLPLILAGLLAVTAVGAAGQDTEEPDPLAPAAGVNADKVDGRHAIKYTSKKSRRKGKLMAFGATGYLPANIVKGGVATLAALRDPAGAVNEPDNPVHWNQIQGVPPAVMGSDTTESFIAATSPGAIPPGGQFIFAVEYPVGLSLQTSLVPVANGAAFYLASGAGLDPAEVFERSADGTRIIYYVVTRNVGPVASEVKLRVTVWNNAYLSPSAVRRKVRATGLERLPEAFRR